MNRRDRYGTVSQRSRRLPKNSAIRLGASSTRQRVPRRRRVDDHEVEVARRVQVVQLLHREVVVAVHEAAGDVLVQRVGEHRVASCGVGRVAADELVPAGLRVEHRRPQLARGDAGIDEGLAGTRTGVFPNGADDRARRPAGGPDRR